LLICERFEKNVLTALERCPQDTLFLAAVSGGADSMAMLAAISQLPIFSSKFSVLHVEHGIRPAEESCGDAEFVRVFCKERKIQCRIKHIPQGKVAAFAQRKGIGIEAAARFFRHKALSAEAVRLGVNTRILIAHTKDDALELSLMRILRGSGPAGLAAMPQSRGRILRPLLGLTRADVIEYLKAKEIPWREDATNTDEVFFRNKIRRRFVPLLEEVFPSWKTGISAMAQTQSLMAEFIVSEADKRIKWETQESSRRDAGASNLRFARSQSCCLKSTLYSLRSLRLRVSARNNSIFALSTDAENFFAQPQIIREEAVFLAIDVL